MSLSGFLEQTAVQTRPFYSDPQTDISQLSDFKPRSYPSEPLDSSDTTPCRGATSLLLRFVPAWLLQHANPAPEASRTTLPTCFPAASTRALLDITGETRTYHAIGIEPSGESGFGAFPDFVCRIHRRSRRIERPEIARVEARGSGHNAGTHEMLRRSAAVPRSDRSSLGSVVEIRSGCGLA